MLRSFGGFHRGGFEGAVSSVSCPDNIAFDAQGNLWIATDGAPGTLAPALDRLLPILASAPIGRALAPETSRNP